jgi:hypothetical protein
LRIPVARSTSTRFCKSDGGGPARLKRANAKRIGNSVQIRLGLRRAGDIFREACAAILIFTTDEPRRALVVPIGEVLADKRRPGARVARFGPHDRSHKLALAARERF